MADLTDEELEKLDTTAHWMQNADRGVDMYQGDRIAVGAKIDRAIAEIRRHRAMVARLEEWVAQLEAYPMPNVGPFIALELRNRMKGGTNG